MDWWIWILVGIGFFVAELAAPGGFFMFFFGLSALLTGLLALASPSIEPWFQWVLFSVVSVALLVIFRNRMVALMGVGTAGKVDSLVGQTVEVKERIGAGENGSAELRGSSWKAKNVGSAAIEAGARATVAAVDGITLEIKAS